MESEEQVIAKEHVDWCNQGKRGIFCDPRGTGYSRDKPFTSEEMIDVLGCFYIILNPQNQELSEEEVRQYNYFKPLAEYSNQYGIAFIKEDSK